MKEKLYERVIEYYDSQNWVYNTDEEDDYHIKMNIQVEEINVVKVLTVVGNGKLATYTYFPIDIPENKRYEVSEYLTRANYGLKIGKFEMDLEDGECRFSVHTVWDDDILPNIYMLERYIDMGFILMERYGGALMKVMYAGVSPKDAIEMAENTK